MSKEERQRLKEFIEDNFDFKTLKKMGVFGKEIRKNDYEKMAERICHIFDFKSIYEYDTPELEQLLPTVMVGKYADEIDNKGNLVRGVSFLLDIAETEFTCPICGCEQDASDNAKYNNAKIPVVTIKCKGCKRSLELFNDMGGNLTVTEK